MSSLYPAKHIPQGMIAIGCAFTALALAVAVGHFGFGIPVYDKNTGQPSSDLVTAILVTVFGTVGVLLVLAGRAVLRAMTRYQSKRTS